MRIVFLGTGTALNTSRFQVATLVEVDRTYILLDAGSSSELMARLSNAGVSPVEVLHLFVSHLDFDHCSGMFPLVLQRTIDRTVEPLNIYGTKTVIAGLRQVLRRLCWNATCPIRWHILSPQAVVNQNVMIEAFPVRHQQPEYEPAGAVIHTAKGCVVYSGDTAPMTKYGRSVSRCVLIHEASFPHRDAALAHSLGHSTPEDVRRVAEVLACDRTFLTHVPLPTKPNVASLIDFFKEVNEERGPMVVVDDMDAAIITW